MDISAKAVRFDDIRMWVDLSDERTLGIPLVWFPRLLHGTVKARQNWELIGPGVGIHWPDLDEDISVAGLIAGHGDQTKARRTAA